MLFGLWLFLMFEGLIARMKNSDPVQYIVWSY